MQPRVIKLSPFAKGASFLRRFECKDTIPFVAHVAGCALGGKRRVHRARDREGPIVVTD
jgi:hypothetical protein